MKILKQRSSVTSAFVTSLIGWNGFVVLLALFLGGGAPLPSLLGWASLIACVQAAVLKPIFHFFLRLDRGLAPGALAGALFAPAAVLIPGFAAHPILWLLHGAYIGAAVGGFFAYFMIDDARIMWQVKAAGREVDFGHDAHWLEPFVYGAAVYAAVLWPTTARGAAATALVGAMVGVVAAGVSHFSPAAFKERWHLAAALVLVGAVVGAMAGQVLQLSPAPLVDAMRRVAASRGAAALAEITPLAWGAIAGALTFAVTLARGRQLLQRAVS